jgi:hypothetical protein
VCRRPGRGRRTVRQVTRYASRTVSLLSERLTHLTARILLSSLRRSPPGVDDNSDDPGDQGSAPAHERGAEPARAADRARPGQRGAAWRSPAAAPQARPAGTGCAGEELASRSRVQARDGRPPALELDEEPLPAPARPRHGRGSHHGPGDVPAACTPDERPLNTSKSHQSHRPNSAEGFPVDSADGRETDRSPSPKPAKESKAAMRARQERIKERERNRAKKLAQDKKLGAEERRGAGDDEAEAPEKETPKSNSIPRHPPGVRACLCLARAMHAYIHTYIQPVCGCACEWRGGGSLASSLVWGLKRSA